MKGRFSLYTNFLIAELNAFLLAINRVFTALGIRPVDFIPIRYIMAYIGYPPGNVIIKTNNYPRHTRERNAISIGFWRVNLHLKPNRRQGKI